jgi:beta-glucanase (GH16 family)
VRRRPLLLLRAASFALDPRADASDSFAFSYVGGLLTTWNKFCFTSGYIETAVRLPGRSDICQSSTAL